MPNTLEFALLFCSFSDYQIFITTLGMVPIDEEDAPMASPPSEEANAAPSESSENNETSNSATEVKQFPDYSEAKTGFTCLPQRAALLKSMLNFLKKAIQDQALSDSIRYVAVF